jgi:hypothetical protein
VVVDVVVVNNDVAINVVMGAAAENIKINLFLNF